MRHPALGSAAASAALDDAVLEAVDSVAVPLATAAGPLGCFAVKTSDEIPLPVAVIVVVDIDLAGSAWGCFQMTWCFRCTSRIAGNGFFECCCCI